MSRKVETCGWSLARVRADAAAATGGDEEVRIAVGEDFTRRTGKQVVHVRRLRAGECAVGASLPRLRITPVLGGERRAPARFLLYWNDDAPAGWWRIPIPDDMRGRRRRSVRRDVRDWLNANARRGTVTVVEQWEVTPEGDGKIVTAVAFEGQDEAAMFRLSWL